MASLFTKLMSGRAGRTAITALIGLVVCSCTTSPPPEVAPGFAEPPVVAVVPGGGRFQDREARFSNVRVTPDRVTLPAERLERFDEHEAADILRRALIAELESAQRIDPAAPYWLDVTVNAFRLRSTSNTVWHGSMSGQDNIGVVVTVVQGSQPVGTLTARVGSIRGGVIHPSSRGRLNHLAIALSKQIVDDLAGASRP